MKRFVIDTGIWVSALVFKGMPGHAVNSRSGVHHCDGNRHL